MESNECDFVVIGGGTAGLTLASRLSEIPEAKVTVIEAGENLLSDTRVLTPSLWRSLLDTSENWGYKTVPQTELRNRELTCAQGRLLGGTSALNALVFSVNARSNVEAWERLGNPGWDWESFDSNLRKVYSLSKPSPSTADTLGLGYIDGDHAKADGPLKLSWTDQPEDEWPRVWRDTFTNMGYPMVGDPFKGDSHGVFFTAECIDGPTKQRSFAGNTYFKDAMKRDNLKIITNATVSRILLDSTDPQKVVATGVEYTTKNNGSEVKETIKARKEVILCAGALKSPETLELSGIGASAICREVGVPCVIDNPSVGENLQNHPICGRRYQVGAEYRTMDPLIRQEPEAIGHAMKQYAEKAGPFASSNIFSHCQLPFPDIKSSAGKDDLEKILNYQHNVNGKAGGDNTYSRIHREYVESVLRSETEGSVIHLAFPGFAGIGPDGSKISPPEGKDNYFTISTLLAHPLSKGSVHADKTSPQGIRVDPRLLTNPVDVEVFARHVQRLEKTIIKTEPLASRIVPDQKSNEGPYPPGSLADLDTAKEYIRNATFGAYHFTSSCAMMPREHGGVVDNELRVHGCANLRVCDASVMPLVPRANPQSSVYAIAEAANGFIRASWYQ